MKRLILTALAVMILGTSAAEATTFNNFIRRGPPGFPVLNTVEDNNVEWIEKVGGDATRFEVGDRVHVYLSMETIFSSDGFFLGTDLDSPTAGGAGYNLIGRGTFTVSSITDIGGGLGDFDFTGSLEFRESATGYTFTDGITASDAVFDAAVPTIFTLSTVGNDFISADGAPIAFADIPTSGTAVDANFGLTADGISGLVPDALLGLDGNVHDVIGSTQTFSNLLAGNVIGDDDFDLRTNTDFSFLAQTPEPSSFVLFAGLLGMLGFWRMRNRKAKVA